MNKYQEAYGRLSKRTFKHYKTFEEVFDDIDILGELVEKETPKKPRPIFLPMAYIPHKCPVCWRPVNYRKEKFNYCPNCGQKIDWSEEVEE